MSEETTLLVENREEKGKNTNRRLRATGHVPAVVYGGDRDAVAIKVSNRAVQKLLRESGDNAVFLLQLEGTDQKRHTMVHEIQYDALTGGLVHIDFLRINMDEKVRVSVPVEIVGTAIGVKNEGGVLDHVLREVEIECLPGDIPSSLELDVSELHINEHLEAKDIDLAGKLELLEEPSRVIVSIAVPKRPTLDEEEAAAAEEELLETEEAEPEVVGKGKDDEEEA